MALCWYTCIYPSAGIVHSLMMEIFRISNSSYPTTAMIDPSKRFQHNRIKCSNNSIRCLLLFGLLLNAAGAAVYKHLKSR